MNSIDLHKKDNLPKMPPKRYANQIEVYLTWLRATLVGILIGLFTIGLVSQFIRIILEIYQIFAK